MEVAFLHDWHIGPSEAIAIQRHLATRVSKTGDPCNVRLVAGIDVSVPRSGDLGRAAVVVLNYPELELVEVQTAQREIGFPYIPGLLSFRETPVILAAWGKLVSMPDIVLVDGQGIAHPRRFGIACHLGLLLDRPTIGCAKSKLCGEHEPLGTKRGEHVDLCDGSEVIGSVIRTRTGVRPIYVSIGHKISLKSAMHWVLECGRGYRLPEPTRLAHQVAGGTLKVEKCNGRITGETKRIESPY